MDIMLVHMQWRSVRNSDNAMDIHKEDRNIEWFWFQQEEPFVHAL